MDVVMQLRSPIIFALLIAATPAISNEKSVNTITENIKADISYSASVDPSNDGGCSKREKINLFKGKLSHSPASKGECLKCHSLHNAEEGSLLKATVQEVCMSCHEKAVGDVQPLSIYKDKQMNQHKPFEDGKCMCCHEPHVSDHIKLLNKNYPQTVYTSYSEDQNLCIECHSKEAFNKPRTQTATNFRNGNLNLHYRHVNQKKGRSCRVCHEHHGSKYSSLIRSETPFGRKKISISLFEKTETGGTCASSCHTKVKYDRYEPAFNALKVSQRLGSDLMNEDPYKITKEHTYKNSEHVENERETKLRNE